ncbi:MAG TPA: trypsin-like peptidase domain-containing protein [Phycisphaerae bacterium]|nr:trypsin-like peptidase domain-containing protein [Phycisphaerae bacterium]HNU44482.1 trypsin-like peptidase domain-containing protein [Phycisphaerae bacterium]
MNHAARGVRFDDHRQHRWSLPLVWAIGLPLVSAQPPQTESYDIGNLRALESAFVRLAEQVRPSVVAVRTYTLPTGAKPDSLTLLTRVLSDGSGFIISPDGLILTNRHVLEDADHVVVVLATGREYPATLRQADIRSDLAVLRIDAEHLPAVRWGSAERVKVNQWAFAFGNPFGLAANDGKASVTFGVVSAVGRKLTDRLAAHRGLEYYDNLIETSAAINPGTSGGPLLNLDGEVIGITTAIESANGVNQGVGFAIPIDAYTRQIIDTLSAGKPMRYGYLGVAVSDNAVPESPMVARLHAARGARIRRVDEGTPAAAADLRRNDVVLEFNGTPVENGDHLVRLVSLTPVGTTVALLVQRDGQRLPMTVTVGDRFALLGYETTRQEGQSPSLPTAPGIRCGDERTP